MISRWPRRKNSMGTINATVKEKGKAGDAIFFGVLDGTTGHFRSSGIASGSYEMLASAVHEGNRLPGAGASEDRSIYDEDTCIGEVRRVPQKRRAVLAGLQQWDLPSKKMMKNAIAHPEETQGGRCGTVAGETADQGRKLHADVEEEAATEIQKIFDEIFQRDRATSCEDLSNGEKETMISVAKKRACVFGKEGGEDRGETERRASPCDFLQPQSCDGNAGGSAHAQWSISCRLSYTTTLVSRGLVLREKFVDGQTFTTLETSAQTCWKEADRVTERLKSAKSKWEELRRRARHLRIAVFNATVRKLSGGELEEEVIDGGTRDMRTSPSTGGFVAEVEAEVEGLRGEEGPERSLRPKLRECV